MRTEIEKLITEQKLYKAEAYEQCNELLKINKEKLSEEEKRLLEDSILLLSNEVNIRLGFITDLKNLLL